MKKRLVVTCLMLMMLVGSTFSAYAWSKSVGSMYAGVTLTVEKVKAKAHASTSKTGGTTTVSLRGKSRLVLGDRFVYQQRSAYGSGAQAANCSISFQGLVIWAVAKGQFNDFSIGRVEMGHFLAS